MDGFIAQIYDRRERLQRIEGCFFVDPGYPASLQALVLTFESQAVRIEAIADDDQIRLRRWDEESSPCPNAGEGCRHQDLSEHPVWREAQGLPILWAWSMKNQQGYSDGIQFEFALNVSSKPVLVQLVVVASEIFFRTVCEIETMTMPDPKL